MEWIAMHMHPCASQETRLGSFCRASFGWHVMAAWLYTDGGLGHSVRALDWRTTVYDTFLVHLEQEKR